MTKKIEEMAHRPERDWMHSSGETMFVFELTFDDGETGLANAKKQIPWYKVGTEVISTVRDERDGFKILGISKPMIQNNAGIQPNTQFMTNTGNDTTASIVASWAIDHAMQWPQPNKTIQSIRETAIELMDLQHELKVHHKSKYP